MCLQLFKSKNQLERKVAEQDIKCYKVLTKGLSGNGTTYLSIYRDYPYVLGQVVESDMETPVSLYDRLTLAQKFEMDRFSRDERKERAKDLHEINEGLHSYVNLQDAIRGRPLGAVVAEAWIPKGAEYYEGSFAAPDIASYASTQLVVKQLVDIYRVKF
jgi:hypothetical protein